MVLLARGKDVLVRAFVPLCSGDYFLCGRQHQAGFRSRNREGGASPGRLLQRGLPGSSSSTLLNRASCLRLSGRTTFLLSTLEFPFYLFQIEVLEFFSEILVELALLEIDVVIGRRRD